MAASSDYASAFPERFYAGSTLKVEVGFSDYPATDWTATLKIQSAASREPSSGGVSATANGLDFRFLVAAATTASWTADEYRWVVEVSATIDAVVETYTASTGIIIVEPDFTGAAGNVDFRSHARTVLEAIEAVIENRATQDQASYSIAGRSLSKTAIPDLLLMRERYKALVVEEDRRDRRNRGLSTDATIKARF